MSRHPQKWTKFFNKTSVRLGTALVLAVGIAGCADRNDTLSDWDENFADKCVSYGTNSKLQTGGYTGTRRGNAVMNYLSRTPAGQEMADHIRANDIALCFGKNAEGAGKIIYQGGRSNAHIIDNNLSDGAIARTFISERTRENYKGVVKWSEDFKPDDALLWARAVRAHDINIQLAQAFALAGKNFNDSAWRAAAQQTDLAPHARTFQETVTTNQGEANAYSTIMQAVINDSSAIVADSEFMQWYKSHLFARTVPVVKPCLKFNGELGLCTSTQTQYPDKDVSSARIVPNDLVELSSVMMEAPYLDEQEASALVADPAALPLDRTLTDTRTAIATQAEKCCGENRQTGRRGGSIGISIGGSLGITF